MDDAAYLRRLPVISVLTLESTLDIILTAAPAVRNTNIAAR
jgi:hypothetical protein